VGDMREAWDDYKEFKAAEKAAYMPARIAAIMSLRESGHEVRVLVEGVHYRVDGRLDLYPVHRRWHDIKANRRGWYRDPSQCVSRALGKEHANGREGSR
jgi:hypothetical protein